MRHKNKRASTRTRVWQDVEAVIELTNPLTAHSRSKISIKGKVKDIGSFGMFLETGEYIPIDANLDIEILFDPGSRRSTLSVPARGKAVHSTPEGVGIRFTSIDLSVMQKSIIEKMNREERRRNSLYTIGSSPAEDPGCS